jgi:hypothetical protein
MAAIDYLRARGLHTDLLPGGRLHVWPKECITPEVRAWIQAHKQELLQELLPASLEPAGPAHEVEALLVALRQAGHNLGHDLEARLRRAMDKMSRQARAELAAAIDDAFEAGTSIEQARLSISRHLPGGGDLDPASAERWVEWIATRCPINADDRRYLGDLLRLLPARRRATAACWYSRAWLQAADAEPLPHRRNNVGRRAANATLRPVRRGGGQ